MLRRTRFEPVQDPVADARILDVLKLGADRVGVNAFERRDHFAQGHLSVVEKEFGRDLQIEVLLAEAELAQTQERIFRSLVGQRIHPRDRVPEGAISVNQTIDAGLQRDSSARVRPRVQRPRSAPLRCGVLPSSKPSKKARQLGVDRLRDSSPSDDSFPRSGRGCRGSQMTGRMVLESICWRYARRGKLTVPDGFDVRLQAEPA